MKEIKFRAWIKTHHEMVTVELIDFNEEYIAHEDLSDSPVTAIEPSDPECVTEFKDCDIMQCTGIKDKNGIMIYKGDIVKASTKNSESKFEVVYSEEWGCWELKNLKVDAEFRYQLGSFKKMDPIVIGNIHENLELLEEEE